MINFLKRPYKETGNGKSIILSIAAFGPFIFLFLYLFKPIGIYELKQLQQLFMTMGFGLITFAVVCIYKFLIEPVAETENWTFGKNILRDIMMPQ